MIADGPAAEPDVPEPARRAATSGRPGGAGLAGPATAVLAETLDILCRGEPLRISEIGDHTDLVAEVADALSALTDRLAHDLTAGAPEVDAVDAVRDLYVIRDGLARASSTARHCADALYRAHLDSKPPPGS